MVLKLSIMYGKHETVPTAHHHIQNQFKVDWGCKYKRQTLKLLEEITAENYCFVSS